MATQHPKVIIGLTGGIASGKSTVGQLFRELGIDVIDADQCARTVVEKGSMGLQKIVDQFGQDMLDDNGHLNRAKLREHIFSDDQARQTLNDITHPLINQEMLQQITASTSEYIVLEIPLLVEGLMRDLVSHVLVIDVQPEVQIERLTKRDKVSNIQAQAILEAQASREERLAIADFIINNNDDQRDLTPDVSKLHQTYLALSSA